MIDFNTEPYNDDFSEDNKFYRILFRPSFAVQARELTQLQTILQNQVTRQGNHLFREGSMVIPGQVSIDTKAAYVKLKPIYNSVVTDTFIQNCEGKFCTGSSGIKAQIIKVVRAEGADPTTIFVRYTSSGTDNIAKVFLEDEVIEIDDGTGTFQAYATDATGTGSTATVQRGVYFVKGFFVLCADPVTGGAQTIVLDKYTNTPSYRVGLNVLEATIVPEDDETLLDNAQTSYNFAAPGAHRYHIDLILAKKTLTTEEDDNFIQLLSTASGAIKRIVNKTEYSELEKTFARRTFDESGNYDVRPFIMDVREARNNDRGSWTAGETTLIGDVVLSNGYTYIAKNNGTTVSIAPNHTSGTAYDGPGSTGIQWEYNEFPYYNRGVSKTGSDDQLALVMDAGKAYVQGYEIEKVSSEVLLVDKCRDTDHQVQVDNAYIPQTIGNYVLVNTIQSCPPVDTFDTVDLYNQFTQESAVAISGTLSVSSGGTALTASGSTGAFTTQLIIGSKIYNSSNVYVGTITAIASDNAATITAAAVALSSATGVKKDGRGTAVGTKVGTARVRAIEWHNGTIGTDACQYKLMIFDIKMISGYDFTQNVKSFYYNNSAGGFVKDFSADIVPVTLSLRGTVTASSTSVTGTGTSVATDLVANDYVYLGTEFRRVTTTPTNDLAFTVSSSVTVTGGALKLIGTEIKEPNNEEAFFSFPFYMIKSVRGSDGTKQLSYTVYEKFSGTSSSGSGGYCTLTVSTGSGTLGSAAETDNYQLIDNTTGKTVLVDPSNINPSGSAVSFTLPDTYASRAFIVIGTVQKTLSANTEKTKTLTSSSATFSTQAAATNQQLSLGVADAYRVITIKQATGFAFGSSPTSTDYVEDISDRYFFEDGQTSTYYGLSYLKLKPSYSPPNAPVRVEFEYFTHGTGDYFTVNSYAGIDYKKIPQFGQIPLRDVVDFRPRVDTTGLAFTGSGGSTSLVPKRGYDIEADFSYYMGRSDKVAIDFNGNFFDIQGVPSLTPAVPSDPTVGMVLYTVNLEPYTLSTLPESVKVTKMENKRYTMRDIGKLEKRIDTLEYYTSLSMLEQETQSLQITDSATGLNRFKNGFIVDNFAGHSTGDTTNDDYFCSVDMEKNELRPFYYMKNMNLIEKNSTTEDRSANHYQLSGDVITLPILDHLPIVDQPYASRLENINPFAIFTFIGSVGLTPSSDEWFETDRRPDIVQNEEGDFNTIQDLAQKAGVLGTVWNAWQTQWTGAPVSSGIQTFVGDKRGAGVAGAQFDGAGLDAMFGNNESGSGWAHRVVQAETFAQQVSQSRTGINTKVVARIDKRQVADKVLSTAVIPFIRSRNILIQATGLKPGTKFYPFFDKVDISSYSTPATKITFTGSASFDTSSNVGGNSTETARRIGTDTQICLNRGDVLTGSTSNATGVVVGTDKTFNTDGTVNTRAVYIVNVKGTFVSGETITGSISNDTAIVDVVGTTKVQGDSLVTNDNGELQLLFNIPNTDAVRFRAGQREFTLTDISTNANTYTSRGRAQYYAQGILETKQATFVATRNGTIVQEPVEGNQTFVQTTQRVVSDTGWYDPLAQTFLVKSSGGAFLTKIDVFFATKDLNIPVSIEIREVVNGYPGKLVLPFSRVTKKPEDVNISANEVTLADGTTAASYDTATTFEFPSPIYVQDNQEYALVLLSDSNGYKVWVSNLGDKIPNSNRTISEQPYAGVLFKSQNGSTWTANQDQDLKFKVYRAQFDTEVEGTVQFVNDVLPYKELDKDPFETNTGSSKVKVFQNNHGFSQNSYVTITNTDQSKIYGVPASSGTIQSSTGSPTLEGTDTSFLTDIGSGTEGSGTVIYTSENVYVGVVASVTDDVTLTMVSNGAITLSTDTEFKFVAPINGIPVTEVYRSNQVTSIVDNNSFIITCTTSATKIGYYGGTTVTSTQNSSYCAVQPIVAMQSFSETNSQFSIKTTSGKSVNGSEAPYAIDSNFTGIVPNETNYFVTPKLIASEENEAEMMEGNKSVTLQCKISSTNDALSPVLDTHRFSLIGINNTINQPTETTFNQSGVDDIVLVSSNTTIGFTTETSSGAKNAVMYSTNSTVRGLFQTIPVGKYITTTGAANAANNGTFLVTKVTDDGTTTSVTLYTTGYSSGASSSTTVKVRNSFVDEIATSGTSTHSKYVTKKINLATAASVLKVKLAVNCPAAANLLLYYKTSPVGTKSGYDSINYVYAAPDVGTLPKTEIGNNVFTDVEWTITGLTPFDAFTAKLVMQSTNSCGVPRVKDLRIVACT